MPRWPASRPRPGSEAGQPAWAIATSPAASKPATPSLRSSIEESAVEMVNALTAEEAPTAKPVPQVEYPAHARRDPRFAGTLDPETYGLGPRPWGAASGKSLEILMRRMATPFASRWAQIGLRNALLARSEAPPEVTNTSEALSRALE